MSGTEITIPNHLAGFAVGTPIYDRMCLAIAEAERIDEVKDILDKAAAYAEYARRAKNLEAERAAENIRVRASRRTGQLDDEIKLLRDKRSQGGDLKSAPRRGEPIQPSPYKQMLVDTGLTTQDMSRFRKLAAIPEPVFEAALAAPIAPTTRGLIKETKHRTAFTGENEWYTPAKFLDLVREVVGEIDLDPASHEQAQGVVRAARYFTAEDDGLAQPWTGRVWLNPPYAQPLIAQFVDKLVAEVQAGHVAAAILLTHNSTDTAWGQAVLRAADAVCFTTGRIAFANPEGELASPTQGQMFSYFGADPAHFADVFATSGTVLRHA
jgi:phage N-6-adenine-methyltransferase